MMKILLLLAWRSENWHRVQTNSVLSMFDAKCIIMVVSALFLPTKALPANFLLFIPAGKEDQPLPYLLYLQGGPGFESPRPTESNGWIGKACEDYRVVLLDQACYSFARTITMISLWFLVLSWISNGVFMQRGTGLSTPLTESSIRQMESAEDQAEYLVHFRADNIVKDAEFIRVHLVPEAGPWTILGQVRIDLCMYPDYLSLYCVVSVYRSIHWLVIFIMIFAT